MSKYAYADFAIVAREFIRRAEPALFSDLLLRYIR
jgi:hypothetical protein